MFIDEETKKSLLLCGNSGLIPDDTFKKLLDNTFAALLKEPEVHTTASLFNPKPDVLKEAYATLLKATSEFTRNNCTKNDVAQFLSIECKFSETRTDAFAALYDLNRPKLEVILANIGINLPHIVDASWKIEYIVNSSNLDEADGPLFRIGLLTDVYDSEECKKKSQVVHFTCNSQELQDLVYKLKDAVRHCQKIAER